MKRTKKDGHTGCIVCGGEIDILCDAHIGRDESTARDILYAGAGCVYPSPVERGITYDPFTCDIPTCGAHAHQHGHGRVRGPCISSDGAFTVDYCPAHAPGGFKKPDYMTVMTKADAQRVRAKIRKRLLRSHA